MHGVSHVVKPDPDLVASCWNQAPVCRVEEGHRVLAPRSPLSAVLVRKFETTREALGLLERRADVLRPALGLDPAHRGEAGKQHVVCGADLRGPLRDGEVVTGDGSRALGIRVPAGAACRSRNADKKKP